MNHAKYIVFDNGFYLYPIIFPAGLTHSEVAKRAGSRPLSAGFIRVVNGQVEAYGESLSLGLKAAETDSAFINRELGFVQ